MMPIWMQMAHSVIAVRFGGRPFSFILFFQQNCSIELLQTIAAHPRLSDAPRTLYRMTMQINNIIIPTLCITLVFRSRDKIRLVLF